MELATAQAGILTRRQALCHLTARTVERKLSSGRWRSAHQGVYVTHTGPIEHPARRWIAVLATRGLLGGLSALETLGFRGPRDHRGPRESPGNRIDILLPAHRKPDNPPPGVVVHRTTTLPDSDLHLMGRPPGTMPARSLVDAAQWASSDRRAWAVIAAGFQQRLVSADDIQPVLARMRRARRHALITEAVTWSAGGVHSTAEADFLHLCRRARLPTPVLQRERRGGRGRTNYLDAYFEDHALHVEIDGGHHTDVEQWWADMSRQNELWIPGDRVLRFPAWALHHRPDEVIAQLRAALAHH
ncbi:DUF559 domain-containing protein [Actinoplanes sp. G11-F43]|uniref:DUF559 domain-containing protein n=1 Tax=Actinoplanes sp. G11-F43 TaxID=3424130 RepID=UPI003D32F6D0